MNIKKATKKIYRVLQKSLFSIIESTISRYLSGRIFSFGELQVVSLIENYFGKTEIMDTLFVAEDNGIIKGFMEIRGTEIGKLYVEPCFQSGGVGDVLIKYAIQNLHVDFLWALEKNTRARAFYNCHGFIETGEKEYEEGTTEYLLKLVQGKRYSNGNPSPSSH